MGEWTAWTDCANGQQERTRKQTTDPQHGGVPCNEVTFEVRDCQMPVDCVVSDWSEWSDCVNGTQTKTRQIMSEAAYGGQTCAEVTNTPFMEGSTQRQPVKLTQERSCAMPVPESDPVQVDNGTGQGSLLPDQTTPVAPAETTPVVTDEPAQTTTVVVEEEPVVAVFFSIKDLPSCNTTIAT